MNKVEIIKVLKNIAVFLEIKGENSFKIRSYKTAARALEVIEDDFDKIVEYNKVDKINGIGKALAEKITTLYRNRDLPFYNQLKASIPPGLIDCLSIPGLGGKKIKMLHDSLGIDSINSLKKSCLSGSVAKLDGFGSKSAEKILAGIVNLDAYSKRHLWWTMQGFVDEIIDGLNTLSSVEKASVAGSYRRRLETVGDIDFIVASKDPEPIMEWFVNLEEVKEITAKGLTKSSVRFKNGVQADLRIVQINSFVFALHHFTGSKEHNVLLRQRALSMGYRLSEWGIFNKDGETEFLAKGVEAIKTEADLFKFFNLSMIEPELREGFTEISLAHKGALPKLVESSQIKGVFHNHTTLSDGTDTLEAMVGKAESLGWEYIGFADHSKASFQANGLDESRVLSMINKINAFNDSGDSSLTVFSGIECDILKNGTLDLEPSILEKLDYVVASVHSSFSQSEKEMTARIIRAIEDPNVTMLGHPTGRLLLKREPYKVNMNKIIDAAIANKVVIEINANPHRLDMDWRLWKKATEGGLMCSINPDAHSINDLEYFRAGVNIARKGWIEAKSVLNTKTMEDVRSWFKKRV